MKENEFINTKEPVLDTDLNHLEHMLGFSFPVEVRVHYLRYNGGSPTRNLFKADDRVFVVSQFLSISHGKVLFETSFRHLKEDHNILPNHLVPFAMDPGGDYYCFSTRPEDLGTIWFFIGERYEDPARASVYLAKSLTDFVNQLVEDDD